MSLVSAKCPNCGASIQLDNKRAEAFCSYCGSKVEVQKAINLIKVDRAADLENYLRLANDAWDSANYAELYRYSNLVLELDAKNAEAWKLRTVALGMTATPQDLHTDAILVAGKNAILYSTNKNEMEDFVYNSRLGDTQLMLMHCCTQISSGLSYLKNTYESFCCVDSSDAGERTYELDCEFINTIDFAISDVMRLMKAVPIAEIQADEEYKKKNVEDIASLFVNYNRLLSERMAIYNYELNDGIVAERNKFLMDEILSSFSEEEKRKFGYNKIQKSAVATNATYDMDYDNSGCAMSVLALLAIVMSYFMF